MSQLFQITLKWAQRFVPVTCCANTTEIQFNGRRTAFVIGFLFWLKLYEFTLQAPDNQHLCSNSKEQIHSWILFCSSVIWTNKFCKRRESVVFCNDVTKWKKKKTQRILTTVCSTLLSFPSSPTVPPPPSSSSLHLHLPPPPFILSLSAVPPRLLSGIIPPPTPLSNCPLSWHRTLLRGDFDTGQSSPLKSH